MMTSRNALFSTALALAAFLLATLAEASPVESHPKEKADAVKREKIEWCDVWVMDANDAKPALPRVLLIGDSICRSYYSAVEKALDGKALCARVATSKSICDPSFLKELSLVLDEYPFAVIHINNGLHGWDYSEDDYAAQLPVVLDFIRKHAKGAKLIWANTTPVRKAKAVTELDSKTQRVRERNRIANKIAQAQGIPVNDLFAPVIDHPEFFSDDGVHFNSSGVPILAEHVIGAILGALRP